MLATLADKPFDDPEWIFETKWDGFRLMAEVAARPTLNCWSSSRMFDLAQCAIWGWSAIAVADRERHLTPTLAAPTERQA
jgi:hypothetical protein